MQPNFLIIVVDQMRADHLGCAGNRVVRTPVLDQLAAEGVRLDRHYVNCPLCMPSRATLFTGLTPRGHGVRSNGIPLNRQLPTVPQLLVRAGYRTASVGKLHLTNFNRHRGASLEAVPPNQFPETIGDWQRGVTTSVPTPYYGLQEVNLIVGHNTYIHGDYMLWLQREHPEQFEQFRNNAPKPSPLGAEECGVYQIDEAYHHTRYVADRTIEDLNRRNAREPFFLWCSFPDPHHPYIVPEPWDRMYSPDQVIPPATRLGELDELPPFMRTAVESGFETSARRPTRSTRIPEPHYREIIAYTYGMISLLDFHIGRILEALQARGLAENTVVVFLSDHGDLMGDHHLLNKGPFHFEGLLRVPMMWRWPGHFAPARTGSLTSLLDFAPTILDLAGIPIPEDVPWCETPQQLPAWPGHSLTPLLTGRAEAIQPSVVIEMDEDYAGMRLRTLVTPTHKVTTYTTDRGAEEFGELFDLANDPHELHNLWRSPAHQTLRLELINQLHHRLTQTDSTLPRRISHA